MFKYGLKIFFKNLLGTYIKIAFFATLLLGVLMDDGSFTIMSALLLPALLLEDVMLDSFKKLEERLKVTESTTDDE